MPSYCYDCAEPPMEVESSFLDEHEGHDVRYSRTPPWEFSQGPPGSEYGPCPCGRITVRSNQGLIVCARCARVPTGCTCPTMVTNQTRECPTCGYAMTPQGRRYVCVQGG